MSRTVVFIDTSVLVEILAVPGKSQRVQEVQTELRERTKDGQSMILPTAAIIETGNHIAQLGSARERAALLSADVILEEKLDGMNVMLWIDGSGPRVGTRGGAETSDRSGERGRIAAWAGMRGDALAAGLGRDYVLYGEWLRVRHAVPYERLPGELVGFDLFDRLAASFVGVSERDAILARIGIAAPPLRFRGVLSSVDRLERLLGPSAFSEARAEGLIVRTADGRAPRIAKHIDPFWRNAGTTAWSGKNRLAPRPSVEV